MKGKSGKFNQISYQNEYIKERGNKKESGINRAKCE